MLRPWPTAFAICVGTLCGLPGLAQPGAGGVATTLVLLALLLILAAPAWARGEGGPLGALVCVGLAVAAGGVMGLAAGGVPVLALGWLLAFGATLVALTCALPGPRGQLLASGLGLLLLGWPYLGLGALLPAEPALAAAVRSPLAVLCGSFSDFDVLRASLYAEFDAAQELPYAYLAPGTACLWALGAAALSCGVWGAAAAWRRGRTPTPTLLRGTVVLVLLVAGAGQAGAQEIFTPSPRSSGPVIGDLTTRVQLGYYVPLHAGQVRIDGKNGQSGSKISFRRTLDLDPLFVMPTFEVSFGWANGGRLWGQYLEGAWNGETQTARPVFFEEQIFPSQTFIDSRYRYRTIALGGELHSPITEWALGRVLTVQRYVKHEVRIRGFNGQTTFTAARDSLETFVPTIGVGVDILAFGVVTVYGDIQWLDFRTDVLGGKKGKYEVNYREWRAGVRLELVEHAHVMAEWFSLEHRFRRGRTGEQESYLNELNGVRVQVAILF